MKYWKSVIIIIAIISVSGILFSFSSHIQSIELGQSIPEVEGILSQELNVFPRPTDYYMVNYIPANSEYQLLQDVNFDNNDFTIVGNRIIYKRLFGYKLSNNTFKDGEWAFSEIGSENYGLEPDNVFFFLHFQLEEANPYLKILELQFFDSQLYKINYYLNLENQRNLDHLINNFDRSMIPQNRSDSLSGINSSSYTWKSYDGHIKIKLQSQNFAESYQYVLCKTESYREELYQSYIKRVEETLIGLTNQAKYQYLDQLN